MNLGIILLVVGLALLLDSLVVLLFPKWSMKIVKKWVKNLKSIRKVGLIELIIGIILILIGMNI